MNIIKSRSPYFVTVNEASQIGGKLEIFLWHKGQSEPATPTYTLTKLIPSTTQRKLTWNISNYIKEFIDIINPVKVVTPTQENNNAWCFCKVKRYKLIGSTYTFLDTVLYVGVQGFTEYVDGYNESVNDTYLQLLNDIIKIDYKYSNTNIPYLNLLLETNIDFDWIVNYYNSSNTLLASNTIVVAANTEVFNYKVPLFYNYEPYLVSYLEVVNEDIKFRIYVNRIEECKYTPVECAFINSSGGWQFLTFFKAQSNSISVNGSDYNLLPDAVDYNVYRGQSKVFNINGNKTIKCNTGWVYESYNELIQDLLLSETILLDNKPAKVKTQSFTYKTDLLDRNINFEIEFEYSFDLINNVI